MSAAKTNSWTGCHGPISNTEMIRITRAWRRWLVFSMLRIECGTCILWSLVDFHKIRDILNSFRQTPLLCRSEHLSSVAAAVCWDYTNICVSSASVNWQHKEWITWTTIQGYHYQKYRTYCTTARQISGQRKFYTAARHYSKMYGLQN